MTLLLPLLLVLTLAFDRILTGASFVIFLTTFEAEIASSAVLHPFCFLLGAEIRSNRVQTAHNGVSILVLFSRFGVEVSFRFLILLRLLIRIFPEGNSMSVRLELTLLFICELSIAMESFR